MATAGVHKSELRGTLQPLEIIMRILGGTGGGDVKWRNGGQKGRRSTGRIRDLDEGELERGRKGARQGGRPPPLCHRAPRRSRWCHAAPRCHRGSPSKGVPPEGGGLAGDSG